MRIRDLPLFLERARLKVRRSLVNRAVLSDVLDSLPEGIVVLDRHRRYVAWNKQYARMYANTAQAIKIGGSFEDAVRLGLSLGDYPSAAGREEEWLKERLAQLDKPGERYEHRLKDGRIVQIVDRGLPDGGVASLRLDITQSRQREEMLRALFDGNPLPVVVCRSADWQILAVNTAAVTHYGFEPERFQQMNFADIHCAVENQDSQRCRSLQKGAFKHVRCDGAIIEVELKVSNVVYGDEDCIMIAVMDITDRVKAEQQIAYIAGHDNLTGLPNRVQLLQVVNAALQGMERNALFFLDLEKFNVVNDTLGHVAGDELLRAASRRLKGCVRRQDTVARVGGDEFAIFIRGYDTRVELERLCQHIVDELSRPFLISECEAEIGVSIGVALAPEHADSVENLLRLADIAMYTAKRERPGHFAFFDATQDDKLRTRLLLEKRLQDAIRDDQLEVYYQPLISSKTGAVVCMEALVRWRHPEYGLVSPDEFIPLAERTGLIADIGAYVVAQACRDAELWPSEISVAVNVSAYELNATYLDTIASILRATNFPPSRLQLEVTESAVMTDIVQSKAILEALVRLGVRIAMDDFGTGYSSLSTLRQFPFSKLKIDRAFIRDASSPEGASVLRAIVAMAGSLGLSTTAEGVETLEQKSLVQSLNCCEIQGYLCSPPKPLAEILHFLKLPIDHESYEALCCV